MMSLLSTIPIISLLSGPVSHSGAGQAVLLVGGSVGLWSSRWEIGSCLFTPWPHPQPPSYFLEAHLFARLYHLLYNQTSFPSPVASVLPLPHTCFPLPSWQGPDVPRVGKRAAFHVGLPQAPWCTVAPWHSQTCRSRPNHSHSQLLPPIAPGVTLAQSCVPLIQGAVASPAAMNGWCPRFPLVSRLPFSADCPSLITLS